MPPFPTKVKQLGMATDLAETHFEVQYLTRDDIYDHKQEIQRAYTRLFDTTDPYGRNEPLVADINPSILTHAGYWAGDDSLYAVWHHKSW